MTSGGPRTQHASVGCQGKFLLVSGQLRLILESELQGQGIKINVMFL